jgi:hypothetical protein
MSDYSYIGTGKIYMREAGKAVGLTEVGNASKLNFSVEEDVIQERDYTSPGGGVKNEVRRVKNVVTAMTLHELKPANIAIMLYGTADENAAGTVADEKISAYPGALTRLAHANPSSVVVKDDNAGAAGSTTYDAGDDYEVRPGGIFIPVGSAIQDADLIHVAYSYGAEDVIEALTSAAKEYELFFEGLNEAQSGRPFLVDVYRVRFGATKSFDLIGDNFAGYELTGAVLKDSTKTGVGISPFFKATSVQATA